MRACVLLLTLCQVADAQSIVVSGDGRSLVVSGQPATAVIEQPAVAVIEQPATAVIEQPAVAVIEQPKSNRRFVAMFTSHSCAPCQSFKRSEAPKIRAKFGNDALQEYEMTDSRNQVKYGSRIRAYPTFAICDWQTGAWIGPPVVGITTAEVLMARLDDSPQVRHQPLQHSRLSPNRYIQWPGWGTIDLQTYSRNCNCPMCQSIRAQQQEYQRQLREYQRTSAEAALPDDQKPCPMDTVNAMLDAMQLTTSDVLADLGCGDGRILIAAAKRGIRGIGVELDHTRVAAARQAINDSGVSHMVSIDQGDARNFDTSQATAITAYLYPTLLAELASKMAAVRVAASPFHEVPGLAMVRHGDVWIYHN